MRNTFKHSSSAIASPRATLEYLPIEALKPDPDNAREHTPLQLRQIAKSISAFGFGAPILCDGALKVIAGHGRLEALKLLGWREAPVVRLEHLTPAQARAMALADNKLVENSRFNDRQVALQLKSLVEVGLDFDVEATGFSMGEIDLRIASLGDLDPDAPDPDDAPVVSGPSVARLGDLWTLGKHRLLCDSALDAGCYARLLGGELVASVFADPPYNVPVNGHISGKGKRRHREFVAGAGELSGPEYAVFLSTACRMAAEHSRAGSVHFWCMDWGHIQALLAAGAISYAQLLNICIWVKNNAGMGGLYRSSHEMVAVFRHGTAPHLNNVQLGKHGRNRTNVWNYPGAKTFMPSSEEGDLMAKHPTPKCLKMVADALLDVTARGDLVLDGFVGSGSTLMACERIGRRCRGIELDPLYVDLTIRRWQRMTGGAAVRDSDGALFNDLAASVEVAE